MEMKALVDANHERMDDREAILLLSEIEYVRSRLTDAAGAANDRAAAVRAILEAIDSHARVRRLAAQLPDGSALAAVNRQLQELWAQIQARSSTRSI